VPQLTAMIGVPGTVIGLILAVKKAEPILPRSHVDVCRSSL
jgi:hypothetical protein